MGFEKIVSQDKAVKLLTGTLITKRIPSAFLFTGEPYIGKTTVALTYAKALNCLEAEGDCCDVCQSCKKIELGIHPDVKVISAEKDTISISSVREVEEFVFLSRLEAKYKVVIIRESHKMNLAAANALLKTLEEPPQNTVLILTCENISKLPEPVVSRCFKVNFNPLSNHAIKKLFPEEQNSLVFKLAMGRPGIIKSMNIIETVEEIKNIIQKKEKVNTFKDNEEAKWWIDLLTVFLRDAICQKLLDSSCKILPNNLKIKEEVTLEKLYTIYDELQNIRKNIDLNLNKLIVLNYTEEILRRVYV
ncbi:MAG: DNA polymerase III subunit [Thermodesulfovibrionaceae bacterium]